jgi:non-heme chloroperoxidase
LADTGALLPYIAGTRRVGRGDNRIGNHGVAPEEPAEPRHSRRYIEQAEALTFYTQDPVAWFGFPPQSPVHRIPGFQDAAYDDSARTFNMGGQAGDPAALHHEFQLYCQIQSLPDLSPVTAPVYLYYGDADPLTPIAPHARRWQAAFGNAEVKSRFYPGEGHDAQYRHLDQILVDIAGLDNKVVVCDKGGKKTRLVKESKAEKILAKGGTLGLCAWRD